LQRGNHFRLAGGAFKKFATLQGEADGGTQRAHAQN
jgi:hypothetical protein